MVPGLCLPTRPFYSHVIYLGTKIIIAEISNNNLFYSHVIYLGTKIDIIKNDERYKFYSHVIYLGTKIAIFYKTLFSSFTVT